MADVVFVLISVFVCGFVLAFVVLAIASIFYRVYLLRKQRRKLSPNYTQKCEVATVSDLRRHSSDIEKGSVERLPNELPHSQTARTMSTTTGSPTLPPLNEPQQLADTKSEASARSNESTATVAAENEEQLLGLGQLPKDVQAEQELHDALKKAFGPPEPKLE